MASTYLTRTNGTPTNAKKWTISFWSKSINTSAGQEFFSVGISASDEVFLRLESDGTISSKEDTTASSGIWGMYPNGVYRDANGWRHIVMSFDSTLATATDRSKMYINGEDVSSTIGFLSYTNVPLNFESIINQSGYIFNIGRRGYSGDLYFEGLMSHFHFIDGTAYDADTFGETDATTGIWKPKTAPSVTYGTNGFFLKFENSGAFGTDSSGNANNFTVNGTMTQTIDTPSNVFATLNALTVKDSNQTAVLSNGNLKMANGGTNGDTTTASTLAVSSGKYYCEFKSETIDDSYNFFGVTDIPLADGVGNVSGRSNFWGYVYNGTKLNSWNVAGTGTSYGDSYTTGDIIGIALDMDNGEIYFSKNGTWQNSSDPVARTNPAFTNLLSSNIGGYIHFCPYIWKASSAFSVNFGNGTFGTTAVSSAENPDDGVGIFEYDVPTGYKALCTKSINAKEYS